MKPIFSLNSESDRKFGRGRLIRLGILVAITAGTWTIDRLAAAYAISLTPMAPAKPLLGDWLFAQRFDHAAPALAPLLLGLGIFLLFGTFALEAFPEMPLRRLAQLAFTCAGAGLLANSTSLLLQNGVVMDFLTVNVPNGLAHTLLPQIAGRLDERPALAVLHFVPADLAQWMGGLLTIVWGLTATVRVSASGFARARQRRAMRQI